MTRENDDARAAAALQRETVRQIRRCPLRRQDCRCENRSRNKTACEHSQQDARFVLQLPIEAGLTTWYPESHA
jgi:hypothetical protein